MDKIYYARKEEMVQGKARLALYEDPPPEETETRFIDWAVDYEVWLRNTDIEIEPSENKKVHIRMELVD